MKKCELCNGEICKCEKAIKVSFCPKCKSRDVKYVFELENIFGVIPKMRCGRCGYEMPRFPVLVISKKFLAKSEKAKKSKEKSKIKKKKKKKTGGKKK